MDIGIVGGLERAEHEYSRLARDAGHTISFHPGHSGGGMRAVHQLIDRCDIVVILTDVNSHTAVRAARQRMRQQGRTPLLLRRLGPSRFVELLATLSKASVQTQHAGAPA